MEDLIKQNLTKQEIIDVKIQITILESKLIENIGNKIAIVGSGGTLVALNKNSLNTMTLDNFSTGWRGAIVAEEFINNGYFVVYLCRSNCAKPFQRKFMKADITQISQHIGMMQLSQDRIHIIKFKFVFEYLH